MAVLFVAQVQVWIALGGRVTTRAEFSARLMRGVAHYARWGNDISTYGEETRVDSVLYLWRLQLEDRPSGEKGVFLLRELVEAVDSAMIGKGVNT